MDVHFVNDEEKEAFKHRLKRIRQHLTPRGMADIDNLGLMSAMFEMVEREITQCDDPMDEPMSDEASLRQSFQRSNGKLSRL